MSEERAAYGTKRTWTAQRYNGRAHLLHESGLVHIVKYRRCVDAYKLGVKAIFCCYYRPSLQSKFGWRVEPDVRGYRTLADAKQAGERWVQQRGQR